MTSKRKDTHKIPVIVLNDTSKAAYSIFNENEWTGNSKPIIMSCAAQYSLLGYQAMKIPSLLLYSQKMCETRFLELKTHWEKSAWNVEKCEYLIEIPEFHLNVKAYLATIKTFLDLIVQLTSSEGIVNTAVQGFNKKGEIIGGRLLNILENNAKQEKNSIARELIKFIHEQKISWIDQAVTVRDLLVHPVDGMQQVMFRLEIGRRNGTLKLKSVLQPSLAGVQFDQFAQITLMQVEYFSKHFFEIIKAA